MRTNIYLENLTYEIFYGIFENTYLVCKNGLVLFFFFYYLIHTSQIEANYILDYSIFRKVQITCFNRSI